eukprot:5821095-Prymnesium_polylepis.1
MSIWAALRTGHVRLARASWLVALGSTGGVLARRLPGGRIYQRKLSSAWKSSSCSLAQATWTVCYPSLSSLFVGNGQATPIRKGSSYSSSDGREDAQARDGQLREFQ